MEGKSDFGEASHGERLETTSIDSAFGFGLLHAKNMNVLSEWSAN
jgi:hypothetical protein